MATKIKGVSADLVVVDEIATIGVLAQASAGALAVIPIEQIHPHPHNVRRNAVADEEMVDSLRTQGLIQPLVVIPADTHTPANPAYQLVAGHRRFDGLTQLGATHAQCVIRHDLQTEADQISAMLVENGRREDLTPLEEADGYDLLSGLGWSDTRISKAVGHSTSTVKARRKLTALDKAARQKIDARQITLEQGIALSDLPAEEQKKVLKSQSGFAYALNEATRRVERAAEIEERTAELDAAGVSRLTMPAGLSPYGLNHADHGMVLIDRTGACDEGDHTDCLGYVVYSTSAAFIEVYLMCTDPTVHDDDLTEQQQADRTAEAERQAERDQVRAEQEAQKEAARIAKGLREASLLSAIKNKSLDPTVETLLRLYLASTLSGDEAREDALRLPAHELIKTWMCEAIKEVEWDLEIATKAWHNPSDLAGPYFALLGAIGHERNPVDEALLAASTQTEDRR